MVAADVALREKPFHRPYTDPVPVRYLASGRAGSVEIHHGIQFGTREPVTQPPGPGRRGAW
ncbi:hypothetical protein Acsp05_64380 [Actinokineospora sp. NBRC 105648]|nr:hypothetical protein Acsp05_64380 [Actinokineospora sp. NBRC 105648]